jgi:putative transposase
MTNHVHLLATPNKAESVGQLIKLLGQRYVQYVIRTYRRSGTLWEGRYHSCLAQDESYVLSCYLYIGLNPARAGMVEHPADYPLSSYRANGQGQKSALLSQHLMSESLGSNAVERQTANRELFRYELKPGGIDEIRSATFGNFVLVDNRFAKQVEEMLGRRATLNKPGRPRREQS